MDGEVNLRDSVTMTPPLALDFPPPPDLPQRFLAPVGFQWGMLDTADGAHLRWGHLPAAHPRAECVLVGGFAEFIEKYFETISDLTRIGLSVWCVDWRGQGRSSRPKRRPAVPRRRRFDRDADDLIAFTRGVLPGRLPRFVIAHSMGGAIATLALSKAPALFAGAVLSAPMFGIDTGKFPGLVARLLAAIGAWAFAREYAPGRGAWAPDPQLSADTSLTSHDPERCRVLQAWYTAVPELRVDGATYGWVKTALDVTDRLADPALLARVTTPLLIGVAEQEHHVDPHAAERAAKLIPNATLMAFPAARHELFFERDDIRGPWLAAIDRFISARLA